MAHKKKAIIIGCGVGGLAAAIRLAVQGLDVHVYEANAHAGGKISAFEVDGFHFDAGPSLFTQPANMEELFKLAGEPMEDFFSYQRVDIACKYFYENGKIVNAYTDVAQFAEELETILAEPKGKVAAYLLRSAKAYENIGTVFTDRSLHKRSIWLNKRIGKALTTLRPAYLFASLNRYNRNYFSSPEAVQLFDRFATYNGSDPYKAPAMLSLIPHLEHNEGVFFPKGGMISIANALFQLAKLKAVSFHFNRPVQRIIHHEGHIKGVVVNEQNIDTDVLVSNADIYFTYGHLLRADHRAKRVLKQERSSSAVIFYWGIKKQFPQLELHNIFFSKDHEKEFNDIFRRKTIGNDPTVYINITSKIEKDQAPEGKENWFVMINAPSDIGQDWESIKEALKKDVLHKLSRILGEDIGPLIEVERTLDPVVIAQQTTSFRGSLYGSSSNSRLSAFLRHPNFTGSVRGLYHCGGSVHPGGGIPLCLKSARIISELLYNDEKKKRHR